MPPLHRPLLARTRRRGFTLVELIVVLLIVGILATIATVAYTSVTNKAHATRAQADLRNVAQALLVEATSGEVTQFDRALISTVLEDALGGTVTDGIVAAEYRLGYADQAPQGPGDFSVGFLPAEGDTVTDTPGPRVVLTTANGTGQVHAALVTTTGMDTLDIHPEGTTPSAVSLVPAVGEPGEGDPAGLTDGTFIVTFDTTASGGW